MLLSQVHEPLTLLLLGRFMGQLDSDLVAAQSLNGSCLLDLADAHI